MADWVRALDWMVLCSNPAEATYFASELWQFRLPRFTSLSEETLEAVGPFYLVSMPREVTYISHQSALEMWTPHSSLEKDNSLNHSWTTLEIKSSHFSVLSCEHDVFQIK